MSDEALAFANASLVAASLPLILRGVRAGRAGDRRTHVRSMQRALAVQLAFAVVFIVRMARYGMTPVPGSGAVRTGLLAFVIVHEATAVAVVPLVLVAAILGAAGRIAEHRQLVAVTAPLWMFVSVTGVGVYLVLHAAPRLHAALTGGVR